ncbi:MAG TPA: potassium channel family protein [Candidatus Dormibacteraeota bacterium]|jgi:hypothetical protein|nr:potassium channel family protein [Candidatus Dormibacteraeota bacterium]
MLEALEVAVGIVVVVGVLGDVFQAVVTPRPAAGRLRLSRYLQRILWAGCRWLALRRLLISRRDGILGGFGPALVLINLTAWILIMVVGFGLILLGMRYEITPRPDNLLTTSYLAASSLLTIGFGDYVATTAVSRAVTLAAGASGLAVFALVITFLFSLYGAFQRRESAVVTLQAAAGAPASGVTLLESYAKAGIIDDLPDMFRRWQVWAAEVLDTHLAYPILACFRSSHDNDSWVGSLGAVMDAATLLLTTVDSSSDKAVRSAKGWAKLGSAVGLHCIGDLSRYYELEAEPMVGVERDEYLAAHRRLELAGYQLLPADEGWEKFRELRAQYAAQIDALARYLAVPPAQWIGDRSPLRFPRRHLEAFLRR